jgi:type VI secretion system protein ImpC
MRAFIIPPSSASNRRSAAEASCSTWARRSWVDAVSAPQKDLVARFREAGTRSRDGGAAQPPIGLAILDYDFRHQGADLAALTQVADLCKVAQAPLIAGASPEFFGLKQINLLPKLQDVPQRLHDGAHGAWVAFQKSEQARWTALTVNRWLRPPGLYG